MKITTVLGARPQFIKAGALSRVLRANATIQETIIHTGQHFERSMSAVFFEEMDIPAPDYQLDIHGLSHGAMTGKMMEAVEKVVLEEKPDFILVYGDTNSTLAGALVGSKLHVPVIHVEAGLRSFNMKMPEEINRILTDRVSRILFCPTETAMKNLTSEGFDSFPCKKYLVGDVMEDAALFYAEKAFQKSSIIQDYDLDSFLMVTCHRPENTDDETNFSEIIDGIRALSGQHKVVWLLHPRTRAKLDKLKNKSNILVLEPVSYFDMIRLLKETKLVITDSGGLQKEAYFFNKFCVTIREQTEWLELVQQGYNTVTGANKLKIEEAVNNFLTKDFNKKENLYGGGTATIKITNILSEFS